MGPSSRRLSKGGGRSPRVPRRVSLLYVLSMLSAKPLDGLAIQAALSAPRLSTYLRATEGDMNRALELYGWNARMSSALMLPAHFAEVSTRNAVADALTAVYGPRWPWSASFAGSLPNPSRGYNQRGDLAMECRRTTTEGKVIAELKFVFWQKMFTSRHDDRVWSSQIQAQLPHAAEARPDALRARVYADLEAIRTLRNRIAHHEPIFTRDLSKDLTRLVNLVETRSTEVADWVRTMEHVTRVLAEKP